MKYILTGILTSVALSSPLFAADEAQEYQQVHQTTRFGSSEPIPRYLLLTPEQKLKFEHKVRSYDKQGDFLLQTYKDLYRLSPVVFRGRIHPQKEFSKATVEVQRIYKGNAEQVPERLKISDKKCLNGHNMGNNFIVFLEQSELAPATPDLCELQIEEVYHPAMQNLDEW